MDLKMAFVNKGSPQVLRQSPFSVLYQLHWTVLPRTLKLESQMCVCVCVCVCVYKTQNRVFITLWRNFSPNETVFCSESKMRKY